MAPDGRVRKLNHFTIPDNARDSAVLILLYPHDGEIYLPLIERAAYPGVHSRQIGLPGGKTEPSDEDAIATALRETEEEVGVPASSIEILGQISQLYIPPSNFLVQPIVGVTHARPEFVPDPTEVAALLEAPLHQFTDPNRTGRQQISHRTGATWEVPRFDILGHTVWGATAMMMAEFVAVLKDLE